MNLLRSFLGGAAVLLIGAAGCSGNDDKPSEHVDFPIEEFEHDLAKAYCAAAENCDLGDIALWAWALDPGQCEDFFARLFWGEASVRLLQLHRAVSSGTLRYDPVAAARCVDELATLCPSGGFDPQEWCPEAFEGDFRAACIPHYGWMANPGCPDTIPPPVPSGWRPPAAVGEPCCDIPCGAGLECSYEEVGDPPVGMSTCRARIEVGSAGCLDVPPRASCNTGGVCDENGVCQPIAEAELDQLREAFTPDHPEGSPCSSSDFFRQGLCNVGLVCASDTLTCVPPKLNGATCTGGGECATGSCISIGPEPFDPQALVCGERTTCNL